MTAPAYQNSPGASGTEAVAQSREPLERTTPVAKRVPPRPRKRPHHGSTDQQFDALDRLATETAAELAAIKAALVVQGILVLAEPGKPQVAPSPCHLRPVPGGGAA